MDEETKTEIEDYGWLVHPSNIGELHKAAFMAIKTLAALADHLANPKPEEPDEYMIEECLATIRRLTDALGR